MNVKNTIRNTFRKISRRSSSRLSFDNKKLKLFRDQGYIKIDGSTSKDSLSRINETLLNGFETNCSFEQPTLGQSLINEDKDSHKELIKNYFYADQKKLIAEDLTFISDQYSNYDEMKERFNPSSLKLMLKNSHEFYQTILDDNILDWVEAYMGFKPILIESYVRRNFSAKYKVMNHFWHRDTNHDEHLLKAFFFFTDCKEENGPHWYISGSHKNNILKGKRYYDDLDVENYPNYDNKLVKSIVKKGTTIIEDTRGLHKAGMPSSGYRDLGYAVFLPKTLKDQSGYYKISKDVFQSLSPRAKRYIPSGNIC